MQARVADKLPESVNRDPVQSPAKVKRSMVGDQLTEGKDHTGEKPRDREHILAKSSGRKNDRAVRKVVSNGYPIQDGQAAFTGPETRAPLALDLLSPQSPGHSSARPDSQDTPPPPDYNLDATAMTTFGTMGRGTRRPRGSVSYTEPNLRDKMRRPTKELVDAVGADRLQLIKVEEIKPAGNDAETIKTRTITLKREDPGEETNSAWKELPHSSEEERRYATKRIEPTSPLNTRSAKQLPAV